MDLIAYVFNGRVAPHDESLGKVGVLSLSASSMSESPHWGWVVGQNLPLGVNPNQLKLLPTPLDNILDTQVQLAAHDACMRLAGKLVQEV
jgi:hypothetical protein